MFLTHRSGFNNNLLRMSQLKENFKEMSDINLNRSQNFIIEIHLALTLHTTASNSIILKDGIPISHKLCVRYV